MRLKFIPRSNLENWKSPTWWKTKIFLAVFFLFDLKATDGGGERDKRTVRAGGMRRRWPWPSKRSERWDKVETPDGIKGEGEEVNKRRLFEESSYRWGKERGEADGRPKADRFPGDGFFSRKVPLLGWCSSLVPPWLCDRYLLKESSFSLRKPLLAALCGRISENEANWAVSPSLWRHLRLHKVDDLAEWNFVFFSAPRSVRCRPKWAWLSNCM